MDEIEMLRRYGARSAAKAPPGIDVTADVLETIRRAGAENGWSTVTRPMVMAAAASWLVAVTCGFFGQQAWVAIEDPLGALISPFVVALQ